MFARLGMLMRSLVQRRRVSRELDDELQFHLEQETQSNISAGMSPGEARQAAIRELGGIEQTEEAVRDIRTIPIDILWQDLRSSPGQASPLDRAHASAVRGRPRREHGGICRRERLADQPVSVSAARSTGQARGAPH